MILHYEVMLQGMDIMPMYVMLRYNSLTQEYCQPLKKLYKSLKSSIGH